MVRRELVSAEAAFYTAAGLACETPMGGSDRMIVEKIVTSGGDTSVGEVETYLVGIFLRLPTKRVR